MPTTETSTTSDLVRDLVAQLGAEIVLQDPDNRTFFSHDVVHTAEHDVACVLQPRTIAELRHGVSLITAAGRAVIPRGGGASYTKGYLATTPGAVLIDTTSLARIVSIDTSAMTVTVECGVTWKALEEALRPHGVRTPFWGPMSGAFATVGGALSQHAIIWGAARYGVSGDSVLGLEVVLADGSLLRTGSDGTRGGTSFYRNYGPDLTGLFLGDAGAFGIKATATLRLMRLPAAVATASFSFATHDALTLAMCELARIGVLSECFGLDPVLRRQRTRRELVEVQVTAARCRVRGEGERDRGLRGDRISQRDRVQEREVRALAELRARGMCGVTDEDDPLGVPRVHRDIAVAREQHRVEITERVEDGLRALVDAQHLIAPRRQPCRAPCIDAVRAQAPEHADAVGVLAGWHARRKEAEHVSRTVDRLVQRALRRELRVVDHEPQRAPRVRRGLHPRRIRVELGDRAVRGDHQIERPVPRAAIIDEESLRARQLAADDSDAALDRGARGARGVEQRLEQHPAMDPEPIESRIDRGVGQGDERPVSASHAQQSIDARSAGVNLVEVADPGEGRLPGGLQGDSSTDRARVRHALQHRHGVPGAGEQCRS